MRTFKKTEDTGDFQIAPEGTGVATLTVLAFLGRHEASWQGEVKIRELVGLAWELSEPGPDGRPLAVTETLTASMHEKAKFYSRILALTGGKEPSSGFDLAKLLGLGAIVTTAHVAKADRTYCNITQVGPLPRGLSAPPPSVAPTFYDIDAHDPDAYDSLPSRFKKLVETAESADYRPAPTPTPPPPRPAAPAGAWSGTHSAQAPYAPSAPAPAWNSPPRRPAPPPPSSPADNVPFDDAIPF